MDEQIWTVGKLLSWTTDFLRDKGADSPRLDAEVLLAHARGCQRIELYTAYEQTADDPLRERFRDLVKQRAAGTPVAYLVGQREFFSLSFEVTPDVLIPRPETEAIVVRALDLVKQGDIPPRSDAAGRPADKRVCIADVGTGSGILAICLARHLPQARLWAFDISHAAVEVARRNATRHGVDARIDWLVSDLWKGAAPDQSWDLIVSNPPYVTTAELGQLARDVRSHEPRLALDGGEQGTTLIERLLASLPQRLPVGGRLLMEISATIAQRVTALVEAQAPLQLVEIHRDLAGHARIVEVVHRGGMS